MTPARREELLAAARGLGAEAFNKLVESVEQARQLGRLRYWQEELLARLPVGPVSFEEFVAAFEGAPLMPAPPRPASESDDDSDETREPDTLHPLLGGLSRDEEEDYWDGSAHLPRFAAACQEGREDEGEYVPIRIHDPDGTGVSPQQDAAIAHLLHREDEVFAAVSRALGDAFESDEPVAEFECIEVEVSRLHVGGIAYLGFAIADVDIEHGFQVVYHPAKGTGWGDWEALNSIEEADNL